jgi:predicted dithiol-disulfide oxidoreductase (DUF899 family)
VTDTITPAPATATTTALPPIVSREQWETASAELLAQEKAHMRAGDALAAKRRRLPMVEITEPYTFAGSDGSVSLLDLFDGRSQLIVYHFMFHPDWDEGCVGCSMLTDHMVHPVHLNARGISRVLISRAPLEKLVAYKQRMGWTEPWYSSFGTDFNADFGLTVNDDEEFGISVFLRDGDRIFQTYHTGKRGGEVLANTFTYLDLTPYGRQERWQDVPEGWPQGNAYEWWRRHDQYENASTTSSCGDGEGCTGGS